MTSPIPFTTPSGHYVEIRPCTAKDVDSFLLFQAAIATETTHTLKVAGRTLDPARVREIWAREHNSSRHLRLGCFLGPRMIGHLNFMPERDPPHPWTTHIGRFAMAIAKEFWGQGLGRKLLELMEDHTRTIGISRVEAMVRTQNDRGIRLYTRMGYEIEGTRKQAVVIDGEPQDEYYIAKLLG